MEKGGGWDLRSALLITGKSALYGHKYQGLDCSIYRAIYKVSVRIFNITYYLTMESKVFFNLPEAIIHSQEQSTVFFENPQKTTFETKWTTFQEQGMNKKSLYGVFAGTIPVIRQKQFLSPEECTKMLKVLNSHTVVSHLLQARSSTWEYLLRCD